LPFLAIKDDILYIAGDRRNADLYSITLQCLSELIQDLDFQAIFQEALGLELRRYPAEREEGRELQGMRDLGGCFYGYLSYNTIDHQGRVFHFFQREGKLCVTEVLFGPWLKTRTVDTGIDCKTDDDNNISCCSFGEKILVMAGEENETDMLCALVSIEPGELSSESIHIEEKRIVGSERGEVEAYLVQISENKVWMSFDYSDEIWIGEITGDELVMTMHSDRLPMRQGFQALPTRISGGRFLVAGGGRPCSTSIILIVPGEQFSFEKIGDMPGRGRDSVSTILIKERFVVGFGGWNGKESMNDLWIFDLQTRKASPVTNEGKWHQGVLLPFLAVRNDTLYLLRGPAHSLSFKALASLIQDATVRSAFISTCTGSDHASPSRLLKPQSLSPHSPSAQPERQRIAEFDASLKEKEAEIQTRDQKISQLKASLAETHGNLTEATEALRKSNSRISSLTEERDKVKERLALLKKNIKTQKSDAESLRSELRARDDQLAKLQEEVKRLRQNQVPSGALVIHLPSRTLLPVSFPQKWMLDAPGLEKFNNGMSLHLRSFPHKGRFFQEYKKVFQPLLEESLPRRLFLARAAVPRAAARVRCSSQVSRSLEPGQLLPKGPLPVELRPFPLRPEEKLLDSLEAEQVRWIVRERDAIKRDVMEAAPPSYHSLRSFIKESDPLQREARHASIGKLRSTMQASCALYRVERARGAEEALRALQKAVRLIKDARRQTGGQHR